VFPCVTRPNYLWWAQTWHMQTPLETLGAGSTVLFELRDQVTLYSEMLLRRCCAQERLPRNA
jgi:hypothetical protein